MVLQFSTSAITKILDTFILGLVSVNGMCTLGPRACGMWRYAVVKAWLPQMHVQGNFCLEKIRNETIHKTIPYIVKTWNTTFKLLPFPCIRLVSQGIITHAVYSCGV